MGIRESYGSRTTPNEHEYHPKALGHLHLLFPSSHCRILLRRLNWSARGAVSRGRYNYLVGAFVLFFLIVTRKDAARFFSKLLAIKKLFHGYRRTGTTGTAKNGSRGCYLIKADRSSSAIRLVREYRLLWQPWKTAWRCRGAWALGKAFRFIQGRHLIVISFRNFDVKLCIPNCLYNLMLCISVLSV